MAKPGPKPDGFICPDCGMKRTRVIDSRPVNDTSSSIRRRRRCTKCHGRFTTYERVAMEIGNGRTLLEHLDVALAAAAVVTKNLTDIRTVVTILNEQKHRR